MDYQAAIRAGMAIWFANTLLLLPPVAEAASKVLAPISQQVTKAFGKGTGGGDTITFLINLRSDPAFGCATSVLAIALGISASLLSQALQ